LFCRDGFGVVLSALRIEWAWACARKQRWEEEVDHVQEEMRRYIESAHFHVKQWLSRPSQRATVSSELAHGMGVYANRQAYICTRQAQIAAKMWNLSSDAFFWKAGPAAELLSSVDVPASVSDGLDVQEVDNDVDDESLDMHGDEINDLNMSDVE